MGTFLEVEAEQQYQDFEIGRRNKGLCSSCSITSFWTGTKWREKRAEEQNGRSSLEAFVARSNILIIAMPSLSRAIRWSATPVHVCTEALAAPTCV